jgi:hypothetical protein
MMKLQPIFTLASTEILTHFVATYSSNITAIPESGTNAPFWDFETI